METLPRNLGRLPHGSPADPAPRGFENSPPSSEALFRKIRNSGSRVDPVGFLRTNGNHGGLRRIAGRGYDRIHVVSELSSALRGGVLVARRGGGRRVTDCRHQLLEGHVRLACECRRGVVAEVMNPKT